MADVFISYPYKEREKAELLASTFESRGLDAWLAHKDVSPNNALRDQILQRLDSCKVLVLLVEPTAKPSNWLQLEYMTALESVWRDQEKLLIAVLTGKGDPPAFLRHYNVWRIPEKRQNWHLFSERLADTIKESRSTDVSAQVPGDLKKKWKLRLDELELFAHRVQGEEIIEGAKRYLTTNDPNTNRRAINLLSARYRDLAVSPRKTKKSRQGSAKKQKTS